MPSAKGSYTSLDAIFDESFTSPLVLPDLPYQGAIKLHGTGGQLLNQDTPYEHTGAPIGQEESFPLEDHVMSHHSRKHTISDISDLVSYHKRGNPKVPEEEARLTQTNLEIGNIHTESQSSMMKMTRLKHILLPGKNV